MKKFFFLIACLLAGYNSRAQTDIPQVNNAGPMGGGSWLRFLSGGDKTSIQEYYGLNLLGTDVQPIKVANTSLLIGYPSGANQSFANGNAFISGSVGIGTMNPVSKLSVWGDNATLWGLALGWGTKKAIITTDDNTKPLAFQIAGNDAMTISQTGKVGIGTTTPEGLLSLKGPSGGGLLRLTPTVENGEASIGFNTHTSEQDYSNQWVIGSGAWNSGEKFVVGNPNSGGPIMTFLPTGNVGIGTTSPDAKLVVGGSGLIGNFSNLVDQDIKISVSAPGASDKYSLIAPSMSTNLALGVGGTEKMRINSNGNVGIGNPDPQSKLDVSGDLTIRNLSNTSNAGGVLRFTGYDRNFPGPSVRSSLIYAGEHNYSKLILSSYWDGNKDELALSNGNVGIGTDNPLSKLVVNAGENNKGIEISGANFFSDTKTHYFPALSFYATKDANRPSNASAEIVFSDRPGTYGYPEYARSSDMLFYTSHSYNSAINDYGMFPDLSMIIKSTQDGGSVGIGTANPDAKLAVNGTIHSKEVRVDLNNWPDYVFKSSYNLKSLAEVKSYIDQNHHLPDMPSEQEVAKEGINLGEMNKLLTKKVEELTLYLIEKDKQMDELKINQQKKTNKLQESLQTQQRQIAELKTLYSSRK
ncbi:hypothetical protein HH214_07630 [Mucilaginibacter robiniae]|uniref:Uncharacterized protein n=1 Tax=Mucilaginibacter robiniae TaxID=2728022 RepID=A0A7L5DZU5_9SPHI|nr:hypothetical protein [Mucilaginibacter robiniae]QJD95748.1 hypothetical protein HH214_07630 [Mucilaginibacter robiniae]